MNLKERLYNPRAFFHLEERRWNDFPDIVFGRVVVPGHVILGPMIGLGLLALVIGLPVGLVMEIGWVTVVTFVILGFWVLFGLTAWVVYISSKITVRGPKS